MKNNNGFAISGIMYSMLVLFLMLLLLILANLWNRKTINDNTKTAVLEKLEVKLICESITVANQGQYTLGDKYACNPGDGIERTFYVLGTTNNTVTLIMDRNIGKVLVANYDIYLRDITYFWKDVAVSLPTGSQLATAIGIDNWTEDTIEPTINIPNWLYGNLNCNVNECTEIVDNNDIISLVKAYFTSSNNNVSGVNWFINWRGEFSSDNSITAGSYEAGIRPTITISKTKMPQMLT